MMTRNGAAAARALIVDDERPARERLRRLLTRDGRVEIAGCCAGLLRLLEVPPLRSAGMRSCSITCSSFEMHSLFMLVRRSWASVRKYSCMLLGSRTVITRVGSLSVSVAFFCSRSFVTHFWICSYSGLFSNAVRSSSRVNCRRTMPSTPRTSRKKVTQSGSDS